MKILAMCVTVVWDVGIARASLEYRSIVTCMYWLPCVVLGKLLTISTVTKSSSPDAGKS